MRRQDFAGVGYATSDGRSPVTGTSDGFQAGWPSNRRVRVVALTDAGTDLAIVLHKARERIIAPLLTRFITRWSHTDFAQLAKSMRQFGDDLNAEMTQD